jgi:hypothetical protein
MRRLVSRSAFIFLWLVASTFLAVGARAQLTTETVPDWVQNMLLQNTDVTAWSDPAYAAEELPGLGHKFELFFAMQDDADPENQTNGTISAITTPAIPEGIALAFRNLPPGIKITALDTQLGFKYFFPTSTPQRSCGGGSPRVTLLVDANGDGRFDQIPNGPDFAAHGHPVPFQGCPRDQWIYQNLTDEMGRWEVTPGGAAGPTVPVFPFVPWDVLEAAITTNFPDHKILAGFLVDDSCSFHLPACGKAHYDLLTIENRSLQNDQDTVKK